MTGSAQLTLHLTKACNLRCRYCYYADFSATSMSVDTALTGVRQVLDRGPSHLSVTFFGGEPLTRKKTITTLVPRIRSLCGDRNVSVNFKIPTNGVLLDKPFLRFCEANAVFISLSIDGTRDAHAGRVFPDGTPSYDHALRALRLLTQEATTFATYSVVTPANAGHLARSIAELYQEGSRILITAVDYGAHWTRSDLQTLKKQYRKLAVFYADEIQRRRHFYLNPFDSKIAAHTRPSSGNSCHVGELHLSLTPDGDYYPCVRFVEHEQYRAGDITSGIDETKSLAACAENVPAPEECRQCGIASRCNSRCACVQLHENASLGAVPPALCEHERLITPIADRMAQKLFRKKVPLFINKQYNPAYDFLHTIEKIVTQPKKGERHDETAR